MRPATWVQHRPISRLGSLERVHPGRFLPPLTLVLVLALLTWAGLQQLSTPDVVPASAPATEFSAERAMEDLRVITAEPRAIGSPGNIATREYLIEQLETMGLQPEVQATSVVAESEGAVGFGAGTVTNVIVRVPGTDNTGAIAINAHYDGTSTGPGASDCGSCVVTALESLRATLAGPALKNDLIVAFVDGEESGMLGSAAFVEQHPWARDIRLAVNYEAAGSSGPAFLYVTSNDNDWIVSEFLDVAPDTSAYSLVGAVDKTLPSARLACDLDEYNDESIAGLGFVYGADTPDYHTARDNMDEIDPGSIQQEGGYTVALIQHFGNMDLTDMPASGDRIFFNVLPGTVVHYSEMLGVLLAAAITLLVASLLVLGFRQGELTGRGLTAGTLTFLAALIGSTVITTAIWFAIRTFNSDYQVMLIGTYQTTLYAVAFIAVTVALITGLYTLLRRKVRQHNLTAGVVLGATLTLWPISLFLPGASYLVAWPLLFGLLPLAWAFIVRDRVTSLWARVAMLSVAAIPAVILLPGTLYQVLALTNRYEGITGMPLLGAAMLFVAPLILLLLPHFEAIGGLASRYRWAVPATAAVIALALLTWGNLTSGYDTDHPRPNRIAYEMNADTGAAQWVSFDQHLDAWTGQFFPDGAERVDHESILTDTMPAFTAPAPAVDLDAPEVAVVNDVIDGDTRTLQLRLSSPDGYAHLMAAEVVANGEILAAAINGMPLDLSGYSRATDGELMAVYYNVDATGWELTVTVRSTDPVTVQVEETSDGLPEIPGLTIEPRPADMMPAPGPPLDPTTITRTFDI